MKILGIKIKKQKIVTAVILLIAFSLILSSLLPFLEFLK